MFYEIIYENGEVSVASYDSDEEALRAVTEQHNRAKSGQKNGPQEAPASRVVKVLAYNTHPGAYNPDGTLSADEVQAALKDMLKGVDVVNLAQLGVAITNLAHPMQDAESPHDSRFRMKESKELDLAELS